MVVVTRKDGKNKKKETTAAAAAATKKKKETVDAELSTKSPSETLNSVIEEDKEEKEEVEALVGPSPEVKPARAKWMAKAERQAKREATPTKTKTTKGVAFSVLTPKY